MMSSELRDSFKGKEIWYCSVWCLLTTLLVSKRDHDNDANIKEEKCETDGRGWLAG